MTTRDPSLEPRFRAILTKLWGPGGDDIYEWMKKTRPAYFHDRLVEVMVPMWEMDRVELKTKILCCITLFVGLGKEEVRFFLKMAVHHGIPREQVEEMVIMAGLESGFPNAEKAILIVQDEYAPAKP
jgi:alkylhydroperoxidase/carboxymuconolactone decarboxylase family protein YurZ